MSWHRFKESVRDGVNLLANDEALVLWKKNSSAPDYGPMARATERAAEISAALGREQLAFARQQYAESAPIMREVAQQQMAAQREQMDQARDYYNYQTSTFRPLEKSIVKDARNFDTEAYRQQEASRAAAEAGQAFQTQRAMSERAAASMGINPNSGRFAGMQAGSNLAQAAARANSMTQARQNANQMGYARKLDAAGLGRGLAGMSTAAYGGATGAGSAAGNSTLAAGNAYMNGMTQAGNTYQTGFQNQINGLGNILNNQTKYAISAGEQQTDMFGTALGVGSKFLISSDPRLKENVEMVGVDQRTALNLYEFNYIGDPERRFRGVMADEVELVYPDAVHKDGKGFLSVDYAALGIEMTEVSQ